MAGTPNFMTGKGATVALIIGGDVKKPLEVKSWTAKLDGTKIQDDVNGEDRSRVDFEPNFWSLDLECFNSTAAKIAALFGYVDSIDSAGQGPDVAFGIVLKDKGGTKTRYSGTEGSIDDWSFASGGRTDRIMTKIPLRFRYFKTLAA